MDTNANSNAKTPVIFFFDPTCPWAWMTSRWISEVERAGEVEVTWLPMSLAALNEGHELPADYRAKMDAAWRPARVVAAVHQRSEGADTGRFYTELGTRFHPGGADKNDPEIWREALEAAGLPGELAQAGDDDSYDDALREYTTRAMHTVGDDVGTPVIEVEGVGFFGPVVTPAPKGEAALKLWRGCLAVAQTEGFYELKRSRDHGPIFD